jgi:hypothetical protein
MGHSGVLFAKTLPDPVVRYDYEARPLTFAERSVKNRSTACCVLSLVVAWYDPRLVFLHCCIAQTVPRLSHERSREESHNRLMFSVECRG